MTARFYFGDGRVRMITVAPGGPPRWLIRELPEVRYTFRYFDEKDPASIRGIERVFVRRDYWYPFGFIGPLRDSDYHEDVPDDVTLN